MQRPPLTEARDTGAAVSESRSGLGARLSVAAAAFLARKRVAGKRGPLSEKGIRHWQDATRPWREGEYANVALDLLDRRGLEDAILTRAASHPVSARDELQAFKAVLRYAQARGHVFESSLLAIEPVATPRHEGQALSADELEFMAAYAPSYAFRLVLLAGTSGNRIAEMFTLTDDHVDLAGRALTILATDA